MLISPEIEARLKEDESFLRKCAVEVVKEMIHTYGYTQEKLRDGLRIGSFVTVNRWVMGDNLPSPENSWAILHLAAEGFVPVEDIIRNKVLDQFKVSEKIPRMRKFIDEATKRLDRDGYNDEHGIRRVELVVEQGELSWFGLLSKQDSFKIWVGLAFVGEKLTFDFCRLDQEDATVGGTAGLHLPRMLEDLDESTLPVFDPHYDHRGTIQDWEEKTRWVKEGVAVESGYMLKCYERGMRKELGIPA